MEYSWKDVTVKIGGKVIEGITSIEYKQPENPVVIYTMREVEKMNKKMTGKNHHRKFINKNAAIKVSLRSTT